MAIQSISGVQAAAVQSPATELQDLLKPGGAAKPAGGGASGGGSGGSQDPNTIVSTTTVTNPDGTITTTTTYADGSTAVTTTIDPNAASKPGHEKRAAAPDGKQAIDPSDPARNATLLQAQEQSGADQITPRPKGDLADL